MNLLSLKKIFFQLFKFFKETGEEKKIKKMQKEVNSIYKDLKINMPNDFNNVLDIEIKKTSKILQADINLSIRQKKRILKKSDLLNRLTRNSKKLIKDIKKNIKNEKTIKKRIGTEYNINKRIVNTETHRIKEAAKNKVNEIGNNIFKIKTRKKWVARLINTRDAHRELHNTYADDDGYWYVGGYKTKYPGGFGIAKLDINCKCKIIIERIK